MLGLREKQDKGDKEVKEEGWEEEAREGLERKDDRRRRVADLPVLLVECRLAQVLAHHRDPIVGLFVSPVGLVPEGDG